jgi:uncharacterized caspase-like protein
MVKFLCMARPQGSAYNAAMGRLGLLVLAFLALLSLHADAAGGRRVALIIGNGSYEAAGTLANPVNDAEDMAAKLKAIGFEVVEGRDLGKRDLERRIGDFADALAGADVGLFFYSGHGLQVDGRNYIVPVDARLDVPVKLALEAVPIDEVLDIMENQTATSLVFLDACRNNPFARSLSGGTRSAAPLAGLAQFSSTRGSFIAFSTAPGSVAMDGTGRNSPFVAALLKHIAEPGLSINDLMIEVRRDVVAETKDFQRPWEQGSLLERFEFVPAAGEAPAIAAAPAPAQPAVEVASAERSVGDSKAIESFLRDDYLAPDADRLPDMVRRLYADPATLYGQPMSLDAIVKAKADWFAQWSGWTLSLEPGTLEVTPRGEDGADVRFTMRYDYAPKAAGAAHAAGRARVALSLARRNGGWRIASESSEALP